MDKRNILSVILLVGVVIFFSCDNDLTSKVPSSIYQVPGCKSNSLFKSGETYGDSCFSYSFTDKLVIDFCVSGNYCPDSNRFESRSKIYRDSIIISVTDTAQNLCKWICNYIIHGEFEQLSKDMYFIKCMLKEKENKQFLYTVTVKRTLQN